MKKRIFPLFLSILIPFSFIVTSCSSESVDVSESSNTNSQNTSSDIIQDDSIDSESIGNESIDESINESSSDPSDESNLPNDNTETIQRPKDYPTLCGSFMQVPLFKGYSYDRMKQHLQYMQDVGINILVLQWTFENTSEGVTKVYYDSDFAPNEKSNGFDESGKDLLETILRAAEDVGVKVFIGLNDNEEWWQKAVSDRAWIEQQANIGKKGAKQMYDKYKSLYPNAFYGWYFFFEFYNFKANTEMLNNAAYLLNLYRNSLYEIDNKMPMMLSPYLVSAGASPSETEKFWAYVFQKTDFRSGDIFCCQDSVGAAHITMDELDAYYAAIKNAVDTKEGLIFWANNENFTQSDWSTAPLDRFIEQMKISSKYVEAHITFAYSHYMNADTGKTGYHLAYKEYYENGKLPNCILKAPKVELIEKENGSVCEFKGTAENVEKTLMGVRIYKNGKLLEYIDFSTRYGQESYNFSFTDYNIDSSGIANYSVCLVDYYNNEGPSKEFKVNFVGKNGKNVALGKTYTISPNPESNYPDESKKALTDGEFGSAIYYDTAWVGFLSKPEIVIDLGKTENNIYSVAVNTLGGGSAAVYAPTEISVFVSDDGKNFKSVVSQKFEPDLGIDSQTIILRNVILSKSISGRYVKIAVSTNQSWIFIDEISVYAE